MDSLSDYLLAFCGFGVVCCGGGVAMVFVLIRFTGLGMMFPALTMFSSMLFGEKEDAQENEGPEQHQRPRRKSGSRDFRARAQAAKMDFGAGSQKPKRDSVSPIAPRDFDDSDADDDFDRPSLRSSQNRPRRDMRRGSHDSADDEVFGGMFDEDGDGFPDV